MKRHFRIHSPSEGRVPLVVVVLRVECGMPPLTVTARVLWRRRWRQSPRPGDRQGALPVFGVRLVTGVDATRVTSHSEKELAAPKYKRGLDFQPILAFAGHGAGGTGAALAGILRPSDASSSTATDHFAVTELAWPGWIPDRVTESWYAPTQPPARRPSPTSNWPTEGFPRFLTGTTRVAQPKHFAWGSSPPPSCPA